MEQCIQAMKDLEVQSMECSYNTRSEEECTLERKAVEERELLRELTMSRMSDKMKLLEQENKAELQRRSWKVFEKRSLKSLL